MTQYANSEDATYTCAHYQAKYWYGERTVRRSPTSNPRFSTCCSEGKVVLPFLCHPPPLLTELMDYNGGERSKFSFGVADNNLRTLVQDLITILDIHNPLVQSFRMAKDRFVQSSIQHVTLRLIGNRQHTGRQYNLPTASEVAALIPGDGNSIESRDVIVEERGNEQNCNGVKQISELHPSFMALQETNAEFLGRKFVLPSTFTGGPRHMIQQYQDAMAICRWAGPSDLFVTMTCNLKWPEIQREVENCIPGQPIVDRPDTIACVFKMKLDDLMDDIRKGNHFGRVKAVIYTIEFQKRRLPHCHALIFLHEHDKISSTDEINHVMSAELPSEVDDPIGFNAVCSHMMHGPCGELYKSASCMSRDTCVKGFPKQYCEDTFITRDGWLHYRRPNNGRKVQVGRQNIMLDNRFVVPHNIDLIVKYDCHINVEWCNQGTLVKYLFSYLNKGPDRATIVIEGQRNETNNSTTTTNISNTTYSSRMTTNNTTTTTTNNNNNTRMTYAVILQHQDKIEQYLSCRYISAFESCWHLLGYEMHYRSVAIERLPFHEEGCNRVYFRGDDDVDNVIQRETAAMSKFTEWMKANEMYPELGSNLTYAEFPTKFTWHEKEKVWKPHKSGMSLGRIYYLFKDVYQYISEDVVRKQRRLLHNQNVVFTDQEVQNYTLLELEDILNVNNKSLVDFPELPQLDYTLMNIGRNRLIAAERMYNANEEWSRFTSLYGGLNPQQRDVYDNIMQAVNEINGWLFFVYGCGGTGKTNLWKTIISWIRSLGRIVLSVASSGIASLLLPGGRTAHSRLDNPNADNQVFGGKVVMLVDVTNADDIMRFHNWLIAMGDSRLSSIALDEEDDATWITIPEDLLILVDDKPVGAIVSSTFPDLLNRIQDINYLKERCILSPTNDVVDKINSHVLASMSGEMHELLSVDMICYTTNNLEDMQIMYPPKFLNTLSSYRTTMSIRCHYVDDLHPNLIDKWTLNVMAARVWTTYNPKINRYTSNHAKIPPSLMHKFRDRIKEGCVYKIHMFTIDEYGQTKYRPLYSKIFVQFSFKTFVQPSSIKPELFDRYVFKFVPFSNLQQRIGNDTYLTYVVGVLKKWGPLQDSVGKNQGCNPQLRKIVIVDARCHLAFRLGHDMSSDSENSIWRTLCGELQVLFGFPIRYKLVITVRDNEEDIDCVLFNSEATPLLGITVDELNNKTITEGVNDPDWIVDYLINSLCTQWVVLQIKIDKFNLAPTYVRRYTATKYYGHDVNDLKKYAGSSSSSGSVPKLVYSDLSVSSENSYCDTTDYAIHDENFGSTITEYEEKLMDELEWGHDVSRLKPAATYICTNEGLNAPHTSTNDVIVNDLKKGKAIVDTEPVVVETHVNDFTHDESSSLPEHASDVNKIVCPPSSPTIESDEMPTQGDVDNMRMCVDETATTQHVDIMQDD
ncbi:putative PIF1 DNA helicase/replication protein A1-like protein [Tanacetum coccineum]